METAHILEREGLNSLLSALAQAGYQTVGPTLGEGAIVYGPIKTLDDFPVGWTEEQEGGTYRLKKRQDAALFGYTVGPQSWKHYLFPPRRRLWTGTASGTDFQIHPEKAEPPSYAFFGVRSCELQAIQVQDRVFIQDEFINADYELRRENTFIVAVQCGQAAATCFCDSMNAGPRAEQGFDLALTEVLENGQHFFVLETGSSKGEKVLEQIPTRLADRSQISLAEKQTERAKEQMGRSLDTRDIKQLLYENLEHPRWDQVADRCLTCANCTMVCPTCFCSTVEDITDVTGEHTERWQRWDSCFTMDLSNLHGGSVRASTKSRYRQWMTHKLASWIDQFDSSGCVGCGRCITWCPVGIDLTEEVRVIRENKTLPSGGSSESR